MWKRGKIIYFFCRGGFTIVGNKKYKCPRCKEIKDFDCFYIHKVGRQKGQIIGYCKTCTLEYEQLWDKNHPGRKVHLRHLKGKIRSMVEAKDCSSYLGIVVAEQALSKFFENITRMPNNNPGFDFLCGKGFKIDVKSSTLHNRKTSKNSHPCWQFHIKENKIADYFLLLAFNDRKNLEPQHVWLIPGNTINKRYEVAIFNVEESLEKWSKYEKPLDKVIACCNKIREEMTKK